MARTIIYGGAVSLDGYLADARGAIDWIVFSQDVQARMADYWNGVDAILMGRKTYVDALERMGASARPRKDDTKTNKTEKATRKVTPAGMRTYVFSKTLGPIDEPGVELVRDAVPFVRDLKNQPGGRIILMGGGELAESLFGAGLVDEVGLNIHPILLGAGVPVFRNPGHRIALSLIECRASSGGCILANFTVESPALP
jgi:dihydrofolate reductase